MEGSDSSGIASLNILRPRQNGRRFPDDIFKCIFLNENVRISIKISLNFVPKGPINNIPALVQTMAWRRPGDKPLSEPMRISSLTHICVARPQWVNPKYHYNIALIVYGSWVWLQLLQLIFFHKISGDALCNNIKVQWHIHEPGRLYQWNSTE